MKVPLSVIAFAALVPISAFASGAYDFCVVRQSDASLERLHVRFKYGDIDPGKEPARVIISQRFRQPTTKSIQVTNYRTEVCPGTEVSEITVSASAEQLQNLGNAIAQGNAPGAAVIAVDIAAGATVSVVKGAGKAADGVKNFINRTFGLHL